MSDKDRNSNVEWIRIISMFLIVMGHFSWQTKWNFIHTNIFLKAGIQWLWFGGKLGVDLFILISAYFLSTKKEIKYKSLIKLWKQVIFYSILLTIVGVYIFNLPIGLKVILKTIFPIITGAYWFVTAYVVMYLFAPYLNKVLNSLTKHQYDTLLIMLIIIFSIATIFHNESIGFINDDAMALIGIYPFGVYIKRYKENLAAIKTRLLVFLIFINLLFLYLSALGIDFITKNASTQNPYAFGRFYISVSPFQLGIALAIFLLIIKLPVQHNKVVNSVASHVFAVYLVHCQPLMINLIWLEIVRANRFETSLFVFVYALIVSTLIFIISVALDYLRVRIFMLLGMLENTVKSK